MISGMRISALLFAFFAISLAAEDAEEIIAKARSAIGTEAALNAVESLKFKGVLHPAVEGAEKVEVELLLEKPSKQRLTMTGTQGSSTTIIGEAQGYVVQKNFASGQESVSLMNFEQIRNLKANSAENLYFFDLPAQFQVRTKYLGEEEILGQTADAVRFIHRGGIIYFRFFDPETGELLATRTDNGLLNVEKNHETVGGLRLAREVEAYLDGELVHTLRFSEVQVNPEVPEDAFRVEQL